MKTRIACLALLGLGLALLALPARSQEKKVDPKRIEQLIEQLGSNEFDERERASKELDQIGLPALPALRKMLSSDDVEVRRRAETLVDEIETRERGRLLLVPKRVRLVYKDTPLQEAFADFRRKTGCNIVLNDPQGKLKDRKITLDTGETTFWHALDQFCEKAGLVETGVVQKISGNSQPRGVPIPAKIAPIPPVNPLPFRRIRRARPAQRAVPAVPKEKAKEEKPKPQKDAPKQAARRQGGVAQVVLQAQRIQIQIAPGAVPPQNIFVPAPNRVGTGEVPGQITLVEGKPLAVPTDYSSSVRVRVFPSPQKLGRPSPEEILLGLEATPEPGSYFRELLGLRIEKAIDDQGQDLEQLMSPMPTVPHFQPNGRIIFGRGRVNRAPSFANGVLLPLRFNKGNKPSTSIEQLQGVIQAKMLVPAKEKLEAKLDKASVGKTFKGAKDGSIKPIAVTPITKNQLEVHYQIQFDFTAPKGDTQAGAGNIHFPGGIQIVPAIAPLPAAPAIPVRPVVVPPKKKPVQKPAPKPVKPIKLPKGALEVAPIQIQAQPFPVQVQIQQGRGGQVLIVGSPNAATSGASTGFHFFDEKGNELILHGVGHSFRQEGRKLVPVWTAQVQVAADQGPPVRMVYTPRNTVTLDIPFSLKNIDLSEK